MQDYGQGSHKRVFFLFFKLIREKKLDIDSINPTNAASTRFDTSY